MRCVTGQPVLDHDGLELRVHPTKTFEKTASCVSFAIVLCLPILLDNRFDGQRDDSFQIGMYQCGDDGLMIVLRFVLAYFSLPSMAIA